MAKITTGQVIDLQIMSQAEAKVGDYKYSHLDETTFNNEHLGFWMLCNGQSAVGTLFHTLTGEANVPDAVTQGTFVRQAKAGRALGSYEADELKSHTHGIKTDYSSGPGRWGATYGDGSGGFENHLSYAGGDETRPKNIALNLYVKVNY